MILRKLFILIFKSICIKTFFIFNINETEYKILEKRLVIFFSEAPFIAVCGQIFCILLINLFSIFTKFKLFIQLSDKERDEWIENNYFKKFSLFNLCLQSISSIGFILNSNKKNNKIFSSLDEELNKVRNIKSDLIYDFIIVGSGPGGATAALTLIEKKKKVLIIEEGDFFNAQILEENCFHGLRSLWRNFGMQVCYGKSLIPIIQGKTVGGSSTISGSIIHQFPENAWKKWSKIDQNIKKYLNYKEIINSGNELLNIINYTQGDKTLYENKKVWNVLKNHGFVTNAMNRSINGCKRSENCLIGCRTGGKSTIDKTLIKLYLEKGGEILTKTKVDKYKKNNDLILVNLKKNEKKILNLKCKNLILSCGVIETSKLLKKSKYKNKDLGKGFSCNISSSIAAYYNDKKLNVEGPPMGIETVHDKTKFSTQSIPNELTISRLGLSPSNLKNIDFNRLSTWAISFPSTQRGQINFGLMSSFFKVKFSPNEGDMKKLKVSTIKLISALRQIKGTIIYPQINGFNSEIKPDENLDFKKISDESKDYPIGISHIFGGCCISSYPESGVVDPFGRLKGVSNVMIFDASILPLPTGTNPQLSIMSIVRTLCKKID